MKNRTQYLIPFKRVISGTLSVAAFAGSVFLLPGSDMALGSGAAMAADAESIGDMIFDGNRLITPVPVHSGGSDETRTGMPTPVGGSIRDAASPAPNAASMAPAPSSSITGSATAGSGTAGSATAGSAAAGNASTAGGANNSGPANKLGSTDAAGLVRQVDKKIASDLARSEQDLTMYQQMSQVINWLNQYCVWNHHWPEPVDETNQAVNQLCELVPNNPYKWKDKVQEAEGQSTDPDYLYLNQPMNQPTDASTGFEGDAPNPGTSWEALGNKRIKLVTNTSLTVQEVKEWETDPPEEWIDLPGTITGISNSQNLIVVWGAGADGKPLKVPGSKKTRIFVSNVQMSETGNENQ